MTIFEVENLTKFFGGLAAVDDFSFDVLEDEILGLIGPNGAGKSTVFNLITSYIKPTNGVVKYRGRNIIGLSSHQIARLGIVRTFQDTNLYKDMTVLENIRIAHHTKAQTSDLGNYFNVKKSRQDQISFLASSNEILGQFDLYHLRNEIVRNLPHGYLRALGVAIAIAADPKLLLLDEPVTGMNPEETDRMVAKIKGIRDRGVSIVLVEHDMRAVMTISDRIVVMNFGKKIAEGTPLEIQHDRDVIEAYLGKEDTTEEVSDVL